jgi:hypothetical protein
VNTGQTMITIFVLILLVTILNNFYGIVGTTGDDISNGQDDILANAVAASWAQLAQGLAFDSVTDTSDIAFQNPTALTPAQSLGVEPGENKDSVNTFNDFDDFNGAVLRKEAGSTGRVFTTSIVVSYVDPADVNTVVSSRTFVKRMDLVTWRSFPAATSSEIVDTLHTSIVYGYFNFN